MVLQLFVMESSIRDEFSAKEIYTGVVPGNEVAKRLYESVGFKNTGLVELGMEKR